MSAGVLILAGLAAWYFMKRKETDQEKQPEKQPEEQPEDQSEEDSLSEYFESVFSASFNWAVTTNRKGAVRKSVVDITLHPKQQGDWQHKVAGVVFYPYSDYKGNKLFTTNGNINDSQLGAVGFPPLSKKFSGSDCPLLRSGLNTSFSLRDTFKPGVSADVKPTTDAHGIIALYIMDPYAEGGVVVWQHCTGTITTEESNSVVLPANSDGYSVNELQEIFEIGVK